MNKTIGFLTALWLTATPGANLIAAPSNSASVQAKEVGSSSNSAIPRTPAEVAASWVTTPWKVTGVGSGGGYYYSGFKSETQYGDPSVKPTNPPPLTPRAQARYNEIRLAASKGRNTLDVGADCSTLALPFMIGFGTFEMVFSPNRVTIIQQDGEIRRIWTDGRTLPKEIPLPQDTGYSVGHWEGTSLVIDTVGLRPDKYIEPGLPHSDRLEVHERWTPVEGDRIRNDITFIDPVDFTKPWKATRIYGRDPPKDNLDAALQFLDRTCENNREVKTSNGVALVGPDGKPLN